MSHFVNLEEHGMTHSEPFMIHSEHYMLEVSAEGPNENEIEEGKNNEQL